LVQIALGDDADKGKETFGDESELKKFIRQTVGLDKQKVQELFSKFLDNNSFTADQVQFVRLIIDNISRNGILEPEDLYETPFTYIDVLGIEGLFKQTEQDEIFSILDNINTTTIADSLPYLRATI
ncbi:hypothetical protein KC573_03955, partial [candidate division WWE3 bacterium]|nr:hypothetical protein [candidate division WWE3 bacterium]